MKFDLNILKKYADEGWLQFQYHYKHPLTIWNYTRQTQFEKKWDDVTLSCRGLILDNEGNVIALPLKKFFNMEELQPEQIPNNESYEVYEKMDGSLGLLYNYEGEWAIASRGSFGSEQANKANELLKNYNTTLLSPGYTYILEIIYPENRIVVNYGDKEKLVLLAIINNKNGRSCDYFDLLSTSLNTNFDLVTKYPINSFNLLKTNVQNNSEGYVIHFLNSDFRMKIKGEEYCRLHSLITNFSNVDIWETLKKGDNIENLLERTPDEFDEWVRNQVIQLKQRFKDEREKITHQYALFNLALAPGEYSDRKLYSEKVNKLPLSLRGYIYALYDGKDISEKIWDKIRPIYQKPFWQKQTEN